MMVASGERKTSWKSPIEVIQQVSELKRSERQFALIELRHHFENMGKEMREFLLRSSLVSTKVRDFFQYDLTSQSSYAYATEWHKIKLELVKADFYTKKKALMVKYSCPTKDNPLREVQDQVARLHHEKRLTTRAKQVISQELLKILEKSQVQQWAQKSAEKLTSQFVISNPSSTEPAEKESLSGTLDWIFKIALDDPSLDHHVVKIKLSLSKKNDDQLIVSVFWQNENIWKWHDLSDTDFISDEQLTPKLLKINWQSVGEFILREYDNGTNATETLNRVLSTQLTEIPVIRDATKLNLPEDVAPPNLPVIEEIDTLIAIVTPIIQVLEQGQDEDNTITKIKQIMTEVKDMKTILRQTEVPFSMSMTMQRLSLLILNLPTSTQSPIISTLLWLTKS